MRISLPARGGTAEAVELLANHQGWLAAQVAGWPAPHPPSWREHPLRWRAFAARLAPRSSAHPAPRRDDRLLIGGPVDLLPARTLRWLKAEALADLTPPPPLCRRP